MNIINTNKADMSKRDIYALTRGQSISLKDVENGAEITPDVWAHKTRKGLVRGYSSMGKILQSHCKV